MLDWIENPTLRQECQANLIKGEARHALAKGIFAHSQGCIHDQSPVAQQKRTTALNLVIAAFRCCDSTVTQFIGLLLKS